MCRLADPVILFAEGGARPILPEIIIPYAVPIKRVAASTLQVAQTVKVIVAVPTDIILAPITTVAKLLPEEVAAAVVEEVAEVGEEIIQPIRRRLPQPILPPTLPRVHRAILPQVHQETLPRVHRAILPQVLRATRLQGPQEIPVLPRRRRLCTRRVTRLAPSTWTAAVASCVWTACAAMQRAARAPPAPVAAV